MAFDSSIWRLGAAQALAVASVGGAAASSSAFGAQTYAELDAAAPPTDATASACAAPSRQIDKSKAILSIVPFKQWRPLGIRSVV